MISIVVPNYNGAALLGQHLPGVLAAADMEGEAEVIVVDDGSADDSLEILRSRFPSVRTIALDRNVGFIRACMAGARASAGEILVLLNSDVSVEPDFLAPLREALRDETVFAASAIDLNWGTPEAPRELCRPCFRRGFFVGDGSRPKGKPPYETLYAPGGWAAYRKAMFLALGGFDTLYEPFYMEDADICYRAWKRGWRTVVEPRSLVRHVHHLGAIASTYGDARGREITRRNRLLFAWTNITSRRMLLWRHLLPVVLRACAGWLVLDFGYYLTLARALARLRPALERRREHSACERLSDEAVFRRLGSR